MVSNRIFEGDLESSVTDIRYTTEIDDSCNIPLDNNFEINLSQFINSEGYPLKVLLGLTRTKHRILELVDESQNTSEFEVNLNKITTNLERISYGTVDDVIIESLEQRGRRISAVLQFICNEPIEANYLLIEIIIDVK